MERDWVTTNGLNVLRFGAGRRIWYNSGNFVFTTSNIPTYHKKHKLSIETDVWNWDDCKDADGTVNDIKPNLYCNDIRRFAYYGSCTELIRATIEEIISDFPGRLISSSETIEPYYNKEKKETVEISGYVLRNEFNIDLHHKSVALGKYDNEMRFVCNSWEKYCIKTDEDGDEDRVTKFQIDDADNFDYSCPELNEGKNLMNIVFTTESGTTYTIKGYYVNRNIVYIYEDEGYLSIQPRQKYIDEYFASLNGFKAQLLRQDTKPFYSNNFITPIEQNFTWYYPEAYYSWPSRGYCISIDSLAFDTFVTSLIDMAKKFDELWCDNIYRSMTHESIKNFDWTYSREYYEGEEQDNIDGGERMMKILRVFGRAFDDIKCYIDNIQNMNNITYDKIKNIPEALMSDVVELKGLNVISTIGYDYDTNTAISDEFLNDETIVKKDYSWLGEEEEKKSKHRVWYPTRNSKDIFSDVCDNEMMRRFTLSLKKIMQTKGTQHSIDMMMGMFGFGRNYKEEFDEEGNATIVIDKENSDYLIEEKAFYTKDLIPYDQCVDGSNEEGVQEGEDWVNNPDYCVDWKNIESNTKGDVVAEINHLKDLDILYHSDPYSGIPLRTILVDNDNKPFIVPYYDQYTVYDGHLAFQQKGGWGKNVKDGDDDDPLDDCFDYQETLSYLHVVGSIGEMLAINANTLQNGDIYYVVNLGDYSKYDENPPFVPAEGEEEGGLVVTHYFVLMDIGKSNRLWGWKNIVAKGNTDNGVIKKVDVEDFEKFFGNDQYADWYYDVEALKSKGGIADPSIEEMKSVYEYCFKHMVYLENIFSTNVGNNPHVGYGNYDDGEEFIDYMEHPFKYSIDNKLFNRLDYENIALMLKFNIKENSVSDKIQIIGKTKDEEENIIEHLNEHKDENEASKIWYINTKVMTITNNVAKDENGYFSRYFKSVIMPYLMQVIPSTTILKLKGF